MTNITLNASHKEALNVYSAPNWTIPKFFFQQKVKFIEYMEGTWGRIIGMHYHPQDCSWSYDLVIDPNCPDAPSFYRSQHLKGDAFDYYRLLHKDSDGLTEDVWEESLELMP